MGLSSPNLTLGLDFLKRIFRKMWLDFSTARIQSLTKMRENPKDRNQEFIKATGWEAVKWWSQTKLSDISSRNHNYWFFWSLRDSGVFWVFKVFQVFSLLPDGTNRLFFINHLWFHWSMSMFSINLFFHSLMYHLPFAHPSHPAPEFFWYKSISKS